MTNTVNKKTNEEEISIIISAEHADYLNEIEECFPGLTIDPCYIRKSRGELPMKIIIFLGGVIMSGFTWDIIKLGIQKVYDKFSKKELDFSIKFENMFFSINKDGRVKAITLDHEQFSHIKTLDDLYVYIQEKAQSKMPNVDWKATTLGEITQMNLESISTNFGYDKILYLDTGSITENKIEQLQTVEIKDAPSRAKRLVKEGDIIYSTVRPNQKHFGFMKNPPKNLVVSTGFTVISPEKDIDGKFIYYYITQNYITEKLHQIAEQAVSAYPSIRPENIKQLPIHLPPLPEQQAIAAVLSSFDDKMELLRAENQTLEQMGQELFKERFGAPQPPKGGAYFSHPAEESAHSGVLGAEGKSPSGVVGAEKKSSSGVVGAEGQPPSGDLGASLPEGRRVGKLGEVGIQITQKVKEDSDRVVLSAVNTGNLVLSEEYFSKQVYSNSISKYIVCNKGDFAYNPARINIGSIGRNSYGNGAVSPVYVVFRPKEGFGRFLEYIFKSRKFNDHVAKYSNGSVRQALNYDGFSRFELIIPGNDILVKFNNILQVFEKKIKRNLEQIQTLGATRDQLLPKLMSGEVRVEF